MEEFGNMNTEFIEYQSNLKSIENILGISEVSMWSCKHLAPYITRIIRYLNLDLIGELGTDGKILDYIHELERVWEDGADKIVHEETETWAREVLGNEFVDLIETNLEGENSVETRVYNSDRFVFCWSNILSTLLEQLHSKYWNILHPVNNGECSCCCSKGEDQKYWEEQYSSGVFAEDEETEPRVGKGTVNNDTGSCLCSGYIKNSN
jgi:hypothetical protein